MKTFFLTLIGALFSVLAYAQLWTVKKDGITYASDDGLTCYVLRSDFSITEANILTEIQGCKVTKVGIRAFYHCKNLRDINIPNTIETIDSLAFMDCSSLTKIIIPESVTHIAKRADWKCYNLEAFLVSPGNPYYSSFDGVLCNSDTTVLWACPKGKKGTFKIPEGVLELNQELFIKCDGLDTVVLPSTLRTIPTACFFECTNLRDVNIPNTIETIDSVAFACCRSLTKIIIPENVSYIANSAYSGCENLEAILVSPENPHYSTIEGVLCNSDKTILLACPEGKKGIFKIPEGVLELNQRLFGDCFRLDTVFLPSTLRTIPTKCFTGGVKSVIFPENCQIKSFEYRAFAGSMIDSLSLPSSLQTIPEQCFWDSHIKKVIFPENCQIKEFKNSAFQCAYGLREISIPDCVEKIGAYCFLECINLTNVWLPESVKLNNDGEFMDCRKLVEFHIQAKEPYSVKGVFGYVSSVFGPVPDSIKHLARYLYVPKGCKEKYLAEPSWSEPWDYRFFILEEGQDKSEASIDAIETDQPQDGPSYDLLGRRLDGTTPRNNIIFRNGKKLIVLDRN